MRVTDAILINVPSHVVWAVTIDVERWPEWTPTVTTIQLEGNRELSLGSIARIKQPLQPESEWVVTEFRAGQRLVWETRRTGLHMIGTHELIAGSSGTENVLRVDATGPVAVLLWPLLRWAMRRALAGENRGLKARCEREFSAGGAPGQAAE